MMRPNTRRRARGFSLVEVGVVIGVICILTIGVLFARGFIESAKIRASIQMVKTIEQASHEWLTKNDLLSYAGISAPILQTDRLLPTPLETPWGGTPSVRPSPGDDTRIEIAIPTPNMTAATDLMNALRELESVDLVGNQVVVTTR